MNHAVRRFAAIATLVLVTFSAPAPAAGGDANACALFPIAMSTQSLAGVAVNAVITNILNGATATPAPPVGTRLLVHHGGATRAVEVTAGSGYLSQGPVLVRGERPDRPWSRRERPGRSVEGERGMRPSECGRGAEQERMRRCRERRSS